MDNIKTQIPLPPFLHCPLCAQRGKRSRIMMYEINLEEGVYLCSEEKCAYPFGCDDFVFVKMDHLSYREQLNINNELAKLCENELPSQETLTANIDAFDDNEIDRLLKNSNFETDDSNVNLNESNFLVDGLLSMLLDEEKNIPFPDETVSNTAQEDFNFYTECNKDSDLKSDPINDATCNLFENSIHEKTFEKLSEDSSVVSEKPDIPEKNSFLHNNKTSSEKSVEHQITPVLFSNHHNSTQLVRKDGNKNNETNAAIKDDEIKLPDAVIVQDSCVLKENGRTAQSTFKNSMDNFKFLKNIMLEQSQQSQQKVKTTTNIKNPKLINKLKKLKPKSANKSDFSILSSLQCDNQANQDQPASDASQMINSIHIDYSQIPTDGNTSVPFKILWNNVDISVGNPNSDSATVRDTLQ